MGFHLQRDIIKKSIFELLLQTSETDIKFFVEEKWRNFGQVTDIFPHEFFADKVVDFLFIYLFNTLFTVD